MPSCEAQWTSLLQVAKVLECRGMQFMLAERIQVSMLFDIPPCLCLSCHAAACRPLLVLQDRAIMRSTSRSACAGSAEQDPQGRACHHLAACSCPARGHGGHAHAGQALGRHQVTVPGQFCCCSSERTTAYCLSWGYRLCRGLLSPTGCAALQAVSGAHKPVVAGELSLEWLRSVPLEVAREYLLSIRGASQRLRFFSAQAEISWPTSLVE